MSRRPLRHGASPVLLTVAGALALGAAGVAASGTSSAPVRTELGATSRVAAAPGRTLGLFKVTIPAHAQLALHRHPGSQVAFVAQGALTYFVRTGEVDVMSGPPESGAKVIRRIKHGESATIKTGQWIVEQPTTIHRAMNGGSQEIVIYLATLLKTGSPVSIPVK